MAQNHGGDFVPSGAPLISGYDAQDHGGDFVPGTRSLRGGPHESGYATATTHQQYSGQQDYPTSPQQGQGYRPAQTQFTQPLTQYPTQQRFQPQRPVHNPPPAQYTTPFQTQPHSRQAQGSQQFPVQATHPMQSPVQPTPPMQSPTQQPQMQPLGHPPQQHQPGPSSYQPPSTPQTYQSSTGYSSPREGTSVRSGVRKLEKFFKNL
ncbi:uncharacterized protein K441DRAFT_669491 [Cenococcum geophilum 1.58]|uniref:Uncharacterized protein n=1 Tax=Cenococcum geophilum 1.58 TaxID=794803 RepID=A0ACC8EPB9_9PEZI|nr:hypothetical protein K441DRAFT_669491 [Cenococcum geophilum 1.58]